MYADPTGNFYEPRFEGGKVVIRDTTDNEIVYDYSLKNKTKAQKKSNWSTAPNWVKAESDNRESISNKPKGMFAGSNKTKKSSAIYSSPLLDAVFTPYEKVTAYDQQEAQSKYGHSTSDYYASSSDLRVCGQAVADPYSYVYDTFLIFPIVRSFSEKEASGLTPKFANSVGKYVLGEEDGSYGLYRGPDGKLSTEKRYRYYEVEKYGFDGQPMSYDVMPFGPMEIGPISEGPVVGKGPKTKKSLPDWLKERFNKGNDFNKQNRGKYPYNEVRVEGDGTTPFFAVDSYSPGKEIVSRKFTQLADIKESSATGYLNEFTKKYSPGTKILDATFNPNVLKGKSLSGDMILEVPVQIKAVPRTIIDAATEKGITIRDIEGTVYK